MDLAQALLELWRRKLLVLLGLLIAAAVAAVSAFNVSPGIPPTVKENKSLEYGIASTQLLVDQRESPVGDLRQDFGAVAARAAVYSRLLNTVSVKRRIAERLNLPVDAIITGGTPLEGAGDRKAGANSMSRSTELVGEGGGWRLQTSVSENSPLITITAQAPTAVQASSLANASYRGLQDYLIRMQDGQKVPAEDRAELRQLGTARGQAVNEGTGNQVAILAFVAVFAGWCLLILLVLHIRQSMREQRAIAQPEPAPDAEPKHAEPTAAPEPDEAPMREDQPAALDDEFEESHRRIAAL